MKAADHHLSVQLPNERLWVDGDAVRLAQILANLLNNAARYTQKGGQIALRARREGAQAVVSVRDNGPGFAPADLPQLFEMFGRGARSTGLGIGLALARRLAEMHSGTLAGASEGASKGAEFTLRLPLAEAGDQSAAASTAQGAAVPQRRILVVDDNRDAADSLAMILKLLGADVQVAHDGQEALAAYDRYHPGVVLLDIGMPGMDGYEVARQLRVRMNGERAALVALTGWGQEQDRQRSQEAGFDHHLVKPAEIAALEALLRRIEQ
jgi:CheY-like chemotaxis protein